MAKKIINDVNEFRNSVKNTDFTLISRDCIGGILYHQLGMRFLSPTINLFLVPSDFNYFCLYLKEYIFGELKEFKDDKTTYPVALLYPIKGASITRPVRIDFMHYETYQEAIDKWNERKERINWNNILVISSFCYPVEIVTYSPELVKMWNKIKYKKVMFVDKKYGFKDEVIIDRPKECKDYAWLLFTPNEEIPWRRTFNDFDFAKFLNRKSLKETIKSFFSKRK